MPASGRFVLRLPPELHTRLRARAAAQDSSLNRLCTELLDRGSRGAPPGILPDLAMGGRVFPVQVLGSIHRAFADTLEGVVLFGSVARGEEWLASDVDLLIVLTGQARISRELYRTWEAAVGRQRQGMSRELSPQFVKMPASPREAGGIWLEAAVDGIVLADARFHVSALLRRLRQDILAGRAIRKIVHGQPYWVRAAGGEAR